MLVFNNAKVLGCYPEVISLVDEEFIFGRGRLVSLAKRIPDAYGEQNSENIYCAVNEKIIASTVITRRFNTVINDTWVTGYMIGGVVTRKGYRNQGIASQLLLFLESILVDASFLILWTGIPEFYKLLGWQEGERGLFGRFQPLHCEKKHNILRISNNSLTAEDLIKIDLLRGQSKFALLKGHNQNRYINIPLAAERVDVFFEFNENNDAMAYTALGIRNDTVYIYEHVGNSSTMKDILDYLSNSYAKIYINTYDISSKSFINMGTFDMNPGPNMFFKVLSPLTPEENIRKLYISYLDRI